MLRASKAKRLSRFSESYLPVGSSHKHSRTVSKVYWYKFLLGAALTLSIFYLHKTWNQSVDLPQTSRIEQHAYNEHQLPTQAPRFIVHRSILQKLEELQTEPEFMDRDRESKVNSWPPIVTILPEARKARPVQHTKPKFHAATRDLHYMRSRRFLLPILLPARTESDARDHFLRLAWLSQMLNRTLILPSVGRNHIDVCSQWDFGTYYDVESLKENGVDVITASDLKLYTKSTRQTQLISILPKDDASTGLITQVDDFYDMRDFNLPSCFETKFPFLDLHDFPHMRIYASPNVNNESFESQLVSVLSESLHAEDIALGRGAPTHPPDLLPDSILRSSAPEVLAITIDPSLPSPSAPKALHPLRYSGNLISLADRLAPRPVPYLAVYWQMTQVSPDMLLYCADAVVDSLWRLLSDPLVSSGIRTVWLVTDRPYPYATPQNGPSQQRPLPSGDPAEAIEIIHEAFQEGGRLAEWTLKNVTSEIHQVALRYSRRKGASAVQEQELLEDPGVLGIVEKLVSSRAALFVTGVRACGAESSFTHQVFDMRKDPRGENTLRNFVDTFG